jgi:hypothetical protein
VNLPPTGLIAMTNPTNKNIPIRTFFRVKKTTTNETDKANNTLLV